MQAHFFNYKNNAKLLTCLLISHMVIFRVGNSYVGQHPDIEFNSTRNSDLVVAASQNGTTNARNNKSCLRHSDTTFIISRNNSVVWPLVNGLPSANV